MSKNEEARLILNLAGTLTNQTAGFLKQNGFTVVERTQIDASSNIVFILVDKHNEEWKLLESTYDTIKKGIKIISFSKVLNVKSFISIGGRACISDEIFKDKTSLILAKRIFNDELSLHMDEAFGGNFIKYKNQKIIGHARSGHVADVISIDALEQGFNNVGIRGFIYNIIYYLSYLKQTDIAMFPFDIEYAQNGKFFALQIVAPVKNFLAEYIQDSFNVPNSNDPVDYLLFEAKNLTHFFDISYIEKSNSVVFLAFWFKIGEKTEKRENCFAFNQIKSVKRVYQEIDEEMQALQAAVAPVIQPIKKISEKKVEASHTKPLPGKIVEKLDYVEEMAKILPEDIQDDIINNILGKADEKEDETKVRGTTLKLSEDATLVKGNVEEDENGVRVKGTTQELSEDGTLVKGTKEEEEELRMVKGTKEVLGKDNNLVKGDKEVLGKDNNLVKGSKEVLGKDNNLVKGSKEVLGKDNNLVKGSKEELGKDNNLVKGDKEVLGKDNTTVKGMKEDLTPESMRVAGAEGRFVAGFVNKIKNSAPEEDKKGILKNHVTDFIAVEIAAIYKDKGEPEESDLDVLADVVVNNLKVDKPKARKMVDYANSEHKRKYSKEKEMAVKGESSSYKEQVLIEKLKEKEDAIKQLTTKIEVLKNEITINREKDKKIAEIKVATEKVDITDDEKQIISSKAEYQKTDDQKLGSLINDLEKTPEGQAHADLLRKLQTHESELIDMAKTNEVELKKKDQEMKGKEVFWTRALEASERNLKSKELLLSKAKEGAKVAIEKKDSQLNALQDRINQLSLKVNVGGVSEEQFNQSKELNVQLQSEIEVLKKKMVSLAAAAKNMSAKQPENIVINAPEQKAISEEQFNQTKELNAKLQFEVDSLKKKMIAVMNSAKGGAAPEQEINLTKGPSANESDETTRLKADIQRLGGDKAQTQVQINSLKGENNALKNELNEVKKRLSETEQSFNAQKILAASNSQANQANKDAGVDPAKVNAELNKMIKERDHRIELSAEKQKELEAKIAALLKEKEGAALQGEQNSKTKISQLEGANKKLTADLLAAQNFASETKKEVTKIKAESVGYKNQIDKLKKDLEKAEKASKLKKAA